jgi:ribosomal protein L37AE/L43A
MGIVKAKGNMYPWVTHMHSHLRGACSHACPYCKEQTMGSNTQQNEVNGGTPLAERLGSRIMSEWDICPHCGGTIKRTEIVEDDDEGVLKCDVCGVEFIANAEAHGRAVARTVQQIVGSLDGAE